jgi:alpha-1,6-mannosyltransferase
MQKNHFLVISVLFLGLTFWLGFEVKRADFGQLIVGWLAFFGLIFFILKNKMTTSEARFWVFLGVFLRFLLLFSPTNLSDDVFRFIWDGQCWLAGVHPFAHPPIFYFEKNAFPDDITVDLYEKLNSKKFYTVYPPVCQIVFGLSAFFAEIMEKMAILDLKGFSNNNFWTIFFLKCTLLGAEIGTIWLLFRQKKQVAVVFYALCPLAIFEIIGNVHFEGLMLFFLLFGLYLLEKKEKLAVSALFFALSISTKLLPLMFLPLILVHLSWKKTIKFGFWLLFFSLILWIPMFDWTILKNMSQSLDLYFRAFEFNASFYYIIRPLARNPEGFGRIDLVGPMLAMATILSIFWLAIRLFLKKIDFLTAIFWASCVQLLFSTTVHPWYALVPLVLSFETRWRFAWIWAATVIFSYSHYIYDGFSENFCWIFLEYLLVIGFLLLEIFDRKITKINHLLN